MSTITTLEGIINMPEPSTDAAGDDGGPETVGDTSETETAAEQDDDFLLDDDLIPDIPDEVIPIIVEVPQPDGPFGARGMGEHTMIPAAPIVANAVEDAVGLRLTEMPITAERVALALHPVESKEEVMSHAG